MVIAHTFHQSKEHDVKITKLNNSNGSGSHLIKTYDQNDNPCWFLLEANDYGLEALERTSFDELVDLTAFGEVVASGWGHEVDMEDAD